jgi:hypothetical protein
MGNRSHEAMEIKASPISFCGLADLNACVAFYDALMPRLGLEAVYRSEGFVY